MNKNIHAMREAENQTYCYGVSTSENTSVMMPYFRFYINNVVLPKNPIWVGDGFSAPDIDKPTFGVTFKTNPDVSNSKKETKVYTYYMITGTKVGESAEGNIFSVISNEKYQSLHLDTNSEATEAQVSALETFTGISRKDWFRSKSYLGNDIVNLADIAKASKDKKKTNKETAQSTVNKLTILEANDMVKAINKVSKKNRELLTNIFNISFERAYTDTEGKLVTKTTYVNEMYTPVVFASKLVSSNFKESKIARFKRMSEATLDSYVSEDEVLIEVHLTPNKKFKESYDLGEAIRMMEEAKLTPLTDELYYMADEEGNPTEYSKETDTIFLHDKDGHVNQTETLTKKEFDSLMKARQREQEDGNVDDAFLGLEELTSKNVLPSIRKQLLDLLNKGTKGMAYKTDKKSKVVTVFFTEGKHAGMFDELSGFFSLKFVKTKERGSASSIAKNLLGELDNVASDASFY